MVRSDIAVEIRLKSLFLSEIEWNELWSEGKYMRIDYIPGQFYALKLAVPREEDPLGAVNILRPFAMPLRSLSDYTALPVLHVADAIVESAKTKKA